MLFVDLLRLTVLLIGGAASVLGALLRSSARMRATQSGRSNLIGIRVARALSQ
jgi:hypothetical protein